MAYIGKSPSSGIRNRFIYTATAGQTTFSGVDDENRTLSYTDGHFTDVYLNGVKLDKSDYTATSGTSVVLDEGAAVDDILEVVAFDTFSVFNGEFSADVTVGGTLTANGNVDVTGDLTVDTDTLYVDSTNNNVGIGGSADSNSKLHVFEDTSDADKYTLHLETYVPQIVFQDISTDSTDFGIQVDGGSLRFKYGDASTGTNLANEVMRIDSSGDVQVGTTENQGRFTSYESSTSTRSGFFRASSTSYTSRVVQIQCLRSGSSSYDMIRAVSGTSDIEFRVRGDGVVAADGSISGGGADYAEMFEWDDDNSSNEDRRGYSVVLTNDNKIRKATSSDAAADIIGAISGNPTVLGDAGYLRWSGKYNLDDFGSIIWETHTLTEWTDADGTEHSYHTDRIPSDVTAPVDATVVTVDGSGDTLKRRQLNSSYDDTQTYTPREDRQEWDAVGMMGKLRLRAGQPTGDRWIKMRDIATDDDGNVTVEEWLVR